MKYKPSWLHLYTASATTVVGKTGRRNTVLARIKEKQIQKHIHFIVVYELYICSSSVYMHYTKYIFNNIVSFVCVTHTHRETAHAGRDRAGYDPKFS
jgi:hypothetical protein